MATRRGITPEQAATLIPLVESAIQSYSGTGKDLDAQQELFDIRKALTGMAAKQGTTRNALGTSGRTARAPRSNGKGSATVDAMHRVAAPGGVVGDSSTDMES
jgi:hypothetical protein